MRNSLVQDAIVTIPYVLDKDLRYCFIEIFSFKP